jgi:hypothetical protein
MKIHEYQGKEILRQFGVSTPRGVACFSVDEAVAAAQQLGGAVWVVKAQIHAGGRGKGGGVKVARSLDVVSTRRIRCQPNGTQVALHRLFDPALRLKNMSFVNQTQRILFRCAHLASAVVREGLSGRAKSIEYSHLTTFLRRSDFVYTKEMVLIGANNIKKSGVGTKQNGMPCPRNLSIILIQIIWVAAVMIFTAVRSSWIIDLLLHE